MGYNYPSYIGIMEKVPSVDCGVVEARMNQVMWLDQSNSQPWPMYYFEVYNIYI